MFPNLVSTFIEFLWYVLHNVNINSLSYIRTHARAHTYIHIYIHTYVHTHTYQRRFEELYYGRAGDNIVA